MTIPGGPPAQSPLQNTSVPKFAGPGPGERYEMMKQRIFRPGGPLRFLDRLDRFAPSRPTPATTDRVQGVINKVQDLLHTLEKGPVTVVSKQSGGLFTVYRVKLADRRKFDFSVHRSQDSVCYTLGQLPRFGQTYTFKIGGDFQADQSSPLGLTVLYEQLGEGVKDEALVQSARRLFETLEAATSPA